MIPLFQRIAPVLLLFTCLVACLPSTDPDTYERIERYENGSISRRFHIVKGKKQGRMTDYYTDGKVLAERWFEDDRQSGRTVIYFPSGHIKEVQHYLAGKKNGGDTLWYENGQIEFVTTLEDDKKHGYLRKWHTDGTLVFEAKYDHDTLIEVKGKPIRRDVSAAKPSAVLKHE